MKPGAHGDRPLYRRSAAGALRGNRAGNGPGAPRESGGLGPFRTALAAWRRPCGSAYSKFIWVMPGTAMPKHMRTIQAMPSRMHRMVMM